MLLPIRPARGRYSGLILRLLRDEGPRSRTKLSEDTRLSPTTISKAVAPLLARGWLEESEIAPAGVGRPAIILRQLPEAISICGVQIGAGFARIGIADGWARVRAAEAVTFDPRSPVRDVLEQVAAAAEELVCADGSRCLAVGVAAPGPVDAAHRVNLLSINLGWRDAPVADVFEDCLRLPATVDHNVRAMALAEARYGGHAVASMAYVYVKTGVGLGLVLKGAPFFGGSHGVSELGHIRVQDDGERCACGATGCLETVVSEPYLVRRLAGLGVAVQPGPDPAVLSTVESLRDEPRVEAVRQDLITNLSRGLASVVNLLNPDRILLGGVFADAPGTLIEDIETALRAEVFPLLRDEIHIVPPRLAEAGVSAGAAVALESAIYSDPD